MAANHFAILYGAHIFDPQSAVDQNMRGLAAAFPAFNPEKESERVDE